jgi:hypothetical protein
LPYDGGVTDADWLDVDSDEVRVRLFVKPRASKSRVLGVRHGALEVALAAPPVDGRANDELIRHLARQLGVGRSALSIVSGQAGRHKLVSVRGLSRAEVRGLLLPDNAPGDRAQKSR